MGNIKTKQTESKYAGIYQDLVEMFGISFVHKLYTNYRGQQVVFPMRLYTKEYVVAELLKRYDGHNLKGLALEYGYTERYLHTLLSEETKKKN